MIPLIKSICPIFLLVQTLFGQSGSTYQPFGGETIPFPLKFEKSKYNFKSGNFSGDLLTFVGCFEDDFNYCNDDQTLLLFDGRNPIVLPGDTNAIGTRIKKIIYNFEKQQIEIVEKSDFHEQIQRFLISGKVYSERKQIYWFIDSDLKDSKVNSNEFENYVNQVVKTPTGSKIKVNVCSNLITSTIDSIQSNHPYIHFELEKDIIDSAKYWIYMVYTFKVLIPNGEWNRIFFNSKESPFLIETIQWNKGELTGLNEIKMMTTHSQFTKLGGYYLDGRKTGFWKEIKYDVVGDGSTGTNCLNTYNNSDGKLICTEIMDSTFSNVFCEVKFHYALDTLTNNILIDSYYKVDCDDMGKVNSTTTRNYKGTMCYKKKNTDPVFNDKMRDRIPVDNYCDLLKNKQFNLSRIYPIWETDFFLINEYFFLENVNGMSYFMIREFE